MQLIPRFIRHDLSGAPAHRPVFTTAAALALALAVPGAVQAQGVSLEGAAGPTITDRGYSVGGGVGLSPTSRLTFVFAVERSHLATRRDEFPGGVSQFRGGTFTLGTAALQVSVLGRHRVSPYGLVGFGAGRSVPNVTPDFPTASETSVRAPFAGGGLRVPFGEHAAFFTDLRLMLVVGTEADDLYALAPWRAGLSWTF